MKTSETYIFVYIIRIFIGIYKTRPCWILATYIENDQNWKSTFQQIVAQLHFLKHIYLIFLSSFDQKKHNVHNILQDSRLLAVIQLWYIPLVNNQNHQYFGLGLIPILKLKPKLVNTFGYRLWKSSEEIVITARPKIKSQYQIFIYYQSMFCLPHRPTISDFFDLCLHWFGSYNTFNFFLTGVDRN